MPLVKRNSATPSCAWKLVAAKIDPSTSATLSVGRSTDDWPSRAAATDTNRAAGNLTIARQADSSVVTPSADSSRSVPATDWPSVVLAMTCRPGAEAAAAAMAVVRVQVAKTGNRKAAQRKGWRAGNGMGWVGFKGCFTRGVGPRGVGSRNVVSGGIVYGRLNVTGSGSLRSPICESIVR